MVSTQVVLGSMERLDEYQHVVTLLKENTQGQGTVQGEMVDRILDGGESLVDVGESPVK